jgi:hypothetical protein
MINTETLAQLLRRASEETLGLRVETNNVNAFSQQIVNQFPRCREQLGVMICKTDLPTVLFIMKRSAEVTL